MKAWASWLTTMAVVGAVISLLAASAGATVVATDDFESYGVQNPATDPLVGSLTWNYIDGQGDGIVGNDHRTFFSGGGGSAMQSNGWISQEDGGESELRFPWPHWPAPRSTPAAGTLSATPLSSSRLSSPRKPVTPPALSTSLTIPRVPVVR